MARLTRGVFSVSWTTTYPRVLRSGEGALTTGHGYRAHFDRFARPWDRDSSWSRFWASYLASNGKLRSLPADAGWDYVVPLLRDPHVHIEGPPETSTDVSVLLYPASISVVVRVEAAGDWDPGELAAHLYQLRAARDWKLTTPDGVTTGRSLDGIAEGLTEEAAPFLADDPGEPGVASVLTVAAPLEGEGAEEDLGLDRPEVQAALAGLGVLGPPGKLVEPNLLGENSDPRLPTRTYVTAAGHALWHPAQMLAPSPSDPLGCLHRNHTSLVVQIAALSDVVSWAHESLTTRTQVPGVVQPLVRRAVGRLNRLAAGDRKKTYRSGVARVRIEPLRPEIDVVDRVWAGI